MPGVILEDHSTVALFSHTPLLGIKPMWVSRAAWYENKDTRRAAGQQLENTRVGAGSRQVSNDVKAIRHWGVKFFRLRGSMR